MYRGLTVQLLPNIEFENHENLIGLVHMFAQAAQLQGYSTSIKQSIADKLVTIGCDRGGTYRNKLKLEMQVEKEKRHLG